jgi:hypothetical protein
MLDIELTDLSWTYQVELSFEDRIICELSGSAMGLHSCIFHSSEPMEETEVRTELADNIPVGASFTLLYFDTFQLSGTRFLFGSSASL